MKRPRALDLGHASHISARALQAVLSQVRDEGVPDHFSAAHQRREKQRSLQGGETLLGPIIRDIEMPNVAGGTSKVAIAHPLALLQKSSNSDAGFASFVRRVMHHCGC